MVSHRLVSTVWVVAQFILLGGWCYIFVDLQAWQLENWLATPFLSIPGIVLITAGGVLLIVGTFNLGKNLTPFPEPKPTTHLIQSGMYSRVRHPIYGGIMLILWGFTLAASSVLLLVASLILTLFFSAKSAYEESRLIEQYPDYHDYRKRTWRFIPKP